MSLPALLSKMARHAPRFVTIDGVIVSGNGVVATGATYAHIDHGRVTPVPKHENHGGEPPEENRDIHPWWKDRPELLEQERLDMSEAFPGFTLLSPSDGAPAWFGTLNTGRGKFDVLIVHQADHGLPAVIPIRPRRFGRQQGRTYRKAPHLFTNGNLCVASPSDWDPDKRNVVAVVAWTAHWLASYSEWRMTGGVWPSEGTEVDVA